MSFGSHTVRVHGNASDLSHQVAREFVVLANESIAQRGTFNVVLAGGSTPRDMYKCLADQADSIQWSRVQLFWGDERCVPPTSEESNYNMAFDAFVNHVPIPKERVHRIPGELEPVVGARQYDNIVRGTLAACSEARFDLVLLGMGADGHTASLFPDTAALDESTEWVVANTVPQLDTTRITMTANALNTARQVWFLVCGEAKSFTVKEVLEGAYAPHCHPSQLIQPSDGDLTWHLDADAARNLTLSTNETVRETS